MPIAQTRLADYFLSLGGNTPPSIAMEKLLHQALPAQLRIAAVDVVDDRPASRQGDPRRGSAFPAAGGLVFDPGDIALAKKHLFQVRLQIAGSDDQQPALAVGVVMARLGPLPDLGIHRFDDAIEGRQDRGLFPLAG